MAYDFQMTDRGDFLFLEDKEKTNPFKFSFLPKKGIKISFDINESTPKYTNKNGVIKLSFEVKDLKYNKDAIGISGQNELMQSIMIRLKTPLGDIIDNSTAGSKLELIKHYNISDKKVLKVIQSYVLEAISDIIDNPQVLVEPVISKVTGYSQCIKIYIYSNKKLIYDTKIVG